MRKITEEELEELKKVEAAKASRPVKPINLTFWERIFGVMSNTSHCKLCGDRLKRIGSYSQGNGTNTVYECINVNCLHVESYYETGY